MKITSLNIIDHKHLKDLKLDFTYPEGHAKAGEPLEKICLIGQSATGKSTILELIKTSIQLLDRDYKFSILTIYGFPSDFPPVIIDFVSAYKEEIQLSKDLIKNSSEEFIVDPSNLDHKTSRSKISQELLKSIYITAELLSSDSSDLFNGSPLDVSTKVSEDRIQLRSKFSSKEYQYQFDGNTDYYKWLALLTKILNYRKEFTQFASELIGKGAHSNVERLKNSLDNWQNDHQNPLSDFAQNFNPLIKRLGLEIDLIDTTYFVPVKQLSGESIPFKELSTGTKSLILSFFPLINLDTNNAIILIDEPERSLFPDIQLELMDHYKRMAPNAQFIIATHSPFIAAAFEPEERFILYFDEAGKVCVRRGESPIGDDPNDMLRNDFNVDYYNNFGKQAYQQYRDLKSRIVAEKDPKEKDKLIKEMSALGDKYNF